MTSRRRGFTLVELMVLILVIGVLLGLLLPLLRSMRSGGCSRRMQCASNLRQVGLGLNGFLNAKNAYPNAATFREGDGQNDTTVPKLPRQSSIRSAFNGRLGSDSSADSPSPDYGALHSWVVDVLPYIDSQEIANEWNNDKSSFSQMELSSKSIDVLYCPYDLTAKPGEGNLSFVVNMGFSRWVADTYDYGYTVNPAGAGTSKPGVDWTGQGAANPLANIDIAAQTGVMFLGTTTGTFPWDRKTTSKSLVDGAGQTILATENINAGFNPVSPFGSPGSTNWATPHPNVVGFIASDKVCPGGDCRTPIWSNANPTSRSPYAGERISADPDKPAESLMPYPSSNHSGGIHVLFCDGSVRFISTTIDPVLYSKLITPAGTKLPGSLSQDPIADDEFGN